MRCRAISISSRRFPKNDAPSGQASTHAGCSPFLTRSKQKTHFFRYGRALLYSYFGASKGQDTMQYRHPMQRSLLYFTGPSGVFSSAFTRQAVAQAGWLQCMHCFRTKIGFSPALGVGGFFSTVKASGGVSRFFSKTLLLLKETSGLGNPFFSLHASSQMGYPIHF